ncbi:hypothetical protein T45_04265 [Streptomyces turgidiscabies]|nr:hypothetical protein T45_04265 [Streptomyces turgidiscabies]
MSFRASEGGAGQESRSTQVSAVADHAFMSLTETLARVDADLAAGRVPVARQRLRGLVSSFPYDLTLRRRLAEVYRLYGDAAEAGRWMYLEEDRDADETAAFEARYVSHGWRMKALAWRGPEAMAGTAFAEGQLVAVRSACAEELAYPVGWEDSAFRRYGLDEESEEPSGPWSVSGVLAGTGCLVGVLAFLAIWVNGVVALFD